MMKAVVYTKYGAAEVLEVKEVKKPVPKDNEVLVKIYASTVTSADARLRSSTFTPLFWLPARIAIGMTGPRKTIPGGEFAGEIESVGKDVTLFQKGDRVFGSTGFNRGTNAEYICVSENSTLATKPTNATYEESVALLFGGFSALFFLRDIAKIQSGQKILIIGASGSLGTASIQVAKYFKIEVTGVCSGANFELVKSLGADKLIDYHQEDFTKNAQTYDVIFDTLGKSSFLSCKNSLKQNGIYLSTIPTLLLIFQMIFTSILSGKKAKYAVSPERTEDILFIKELMEAKKIKPVIDNCYTLEQICEAHRYVDKGHKKGNVVLRLEKTKL